MNPFDWIKFTGDEDAKGGVLVPGVLKERIADGEIDPKKVRVMELIDGEYKDTGRKLSDYGL